MAEQDTAFLPWGDGDAVIPLAGAEDVARVAATLLADPSLPTEKVYPLVSATPTVRKIIETLGKALVGRFVITDEQRSQAVWHEYSLEGDAGHMMVSDSYTR